MPSNPNSNEDAGTLRERNRKLARALEECRALLAKTEALLERARRPDQPTND
jgi:hypothetical protein